MIIAIHQPNFLPWLGYFYKIWASDIFVLHDNVEFTKQSFTKRVFIRKTPELNDKIYLSVPLSKHSDFIRIKDLEISQEHNWQQKHINKIFNSYHKTPYFHAFYPIIAQIIAQSTTTQYLAKLNETLILELLKILNIEKKVLLSSSLPIQDFKSDAYNAEIVAHLGGTIYLSGIGADNYQSKESYQQRNISLKYNKIGHYLKNLPPQYSSLFDGNLSILDALFCIGAENIIDIFKAYYDIEHSDNVK